MSLPNASAPGSTTARRTVDTRFLLTVAASALLAGGGAWADGISSTGSGNRSVTTGLDYTTISGNAGGVDVRSTSGTGSATVDVGTVTAAFGNQFGIRAHSRNRDVSITADAVSSQGMGVEGLVDIVTVLWPPSVNRNGNIAIDIGGGAGAVTSTNSTGIKAETGNGIISILAGDVTAGGRGIDASNRGGDISVTAGDVISDGTGVRARMEGVIILGTGTGDVDVSVGDVESANGDGIDARTYFGTIGISAGDVTADNGFGVRANTAFNVDLADITAGISDPLGLIGDALGGNAITVDVGEVNSSGTGISAMVSGGDIGGYTVPGLGGVSVNVHGDDPGSRGDVTSTAGAGIIASTGVGGVHVAAGDVTADGGVGVSATSGFALNLPDLTGLLGGGGGTPDLSGLMGLLDAGVSVDVGDVDASGAGIVAGVTGISVPLLGIDLPGIGNVNVNAGDVDAGGDGITADTGIGYAMVNVGNVDAGGDGIAASAGIGLASVTAGNVSAVGQGVSATVTSGNLGALEDLIDLVGGVPGLEDVIGDLDGIGVAFAMVGDVDAGAGGVDASAGNGAAIAIAGDVTSVDTGVRAAVGDGSGNGIGLALAVAGDVATSGTGAVGIDASAQGIAAALGGNVTTTGDGATGVRVVAQGGALGGLLDGVDDLLGGLGLADLGGLADDLAGGLGLPPGLASGALDLVPDLLTLVDGTAVAAVGSVETSGDNAMGIYAEGTTAVVLAGSVTTTGEGSTGIRNMADGTSITIFGSVNTSGNNAPAVHATDPSSDVWVIGGIATTSGDDSEGIHAWSGTDDVNIYVAGVDTEGHDSGGIHAAANAGDIDIYAGAVTTAGADATGIRAWSGDGDIDVATLFVSTEGDGSEGIRAVARNAGDIGIDAGAVTTAGADATGIRAWSGDGDIDVATLFVSTEGDGSEGIRAAANAGDIGIDAGAVMTAGADATGIRAWSGAGDIDIDAGVIGTAGDYSDGIRAVASDGDVSVDAFAVGTLGAGSTGISAAGGGAVTVNADWVGTAGDDSAGIHAWSSGGPVSVTAEGVGTLGAGSTGIHAAAGAGDVGVTAGNVFTLGADADAIHAWSGDGDVTVDAGGAIALGQGSRGIHAMSDTGSTEVTVHDAAIGGWGAGAAGVEFGGATGAVLNNEGTIAALSGLAIRNDDNGSVVNNDGTVYGRVSMGDGADVFDNNAGGVFAARGTSRFGWGAGDEFNNAGLVRMQWRLWPETVRILGLDTFNNFQDDGSGQVGGTISLANGITGDRLMLVHSDVNAGDAGNGNVFAIDANLTPDGSVADQLHVGGHLSGTFNLAVNDLDSGPGAYDPNGHLFAVVAGDTNVSNFSVNDGDGIDKGLFRYDAYLRPDTDTLSGDNEWYLASTLDREAFEFPIIAGAVQDTWHASTGVWLDRTSDLRLGFGSAQEHATAGAWARFFTGSSDLDFSNTATAPGGMIGPSHTYADTLHQSYHGIVAGFDRVISGQTSDGSDQSWIFGAMLGQTSASLDFGNSVTRVETEATTVGAYVTYLRGGLYVDALLKGDYGTLDYANSGIGASASGDFRSLGFTVDGGYRLDVGSNWFVEPVATLAWVRTTYDGLALPGADVEFDDGESMRGRIGVRVGNTVTTSSGAVVEPWLEASLWNEFQGNYGATIGSSGPDARASYDMGDSWGELSGGVSFLNSGSGWTGFAKASVIIGDGDRQATSANLGVRYTW